VYKLPLDEKAVVDINLKWATEPVLYLKYSFS